MQICCPKEIVSHVPVSKHGAQDFPDEYVNGSFVNSDSDKFDEGQERKDLGCTVTQNSSPDSVVGHLNFHLLPTNCGRIYDGNRITNGNATGVLEFPWMALIAYNKSKYQNVFNHASFYLTIPVNLLPVNPEVGSRKQILLLVNIYKL